MPTRTSHNWKSLPGNFDRLHTATIFHSDNAYGIPMLAKETWIPRWLWPYGERIRTSELPEGGALHFFLDDYRMEGVWNQPINTLSAPVRVGYALTPEFSVYHDWPLAVQLYNIYRNRWMGAFWQSHGVHVIPTVVWGKPETYDAAFAGIEQGSTVATSLVGVNDGESMRIYHEGYREMVQRLKPHHVVFYGFKLDHKYHDLAPVSFYPTRWDSIRKTKAALKHQEKIAQELAEERAKQLESENEASHGKRAQ